MSYVVSATAVLPNDVGLTSEQAATAVEAVEKARKFVQSGMKFVEIRDAQGRTYRPDDFDQLLTETTNKNA
jgi:hypothetical protein